MEKFRGFSTRAIHAGQDPEEVTRAVTYPIFQTSTYAYDTPGSHRGFDYSRTVNPTRQVLETNIASLEEGKYGHAFSSGMGAINTIMLMMKAGDHVICTDNVYGGTHRLFEQVLTGYGLEFSFIDTSDIECVKASIKSNTKMIFVETPTNPMLNLTDIAALSELSKPNNILVAVDNTFMSPYFQRPLTLGADIVLHSSTKYLGGHSDVVGGVTVVNDKKLGEKIGYLQNAAGAVPSPFDCWLLIRSAKTLALRLQKHESNAQAVASFLSKHPDVEKVYYPGLESHPQHDLAKRQMSGFGGMVSAELGNFEKARKFSENVELFILAESLGGVESLLCHPVSMTHATVPKEERLKFGLTDGLVRFSVGVEEEEDILADIENALNCMK